VPDIEPFDVKKPSLRCLFYY